MVQEIARDSLLTQFDIGRSKQSCHSMGYAKSEIKSKRYRVLVLSSELFRNSIH